MSLNSLPRGLETGKVIKFIDFLCLHTPGKKGPYINRPITSFLQYLHEVVYRFRLIENVSYDADIANRIDVAKDMEISPIVFEF